MARFAAGLKKAGRGARASPRRRNQTPACPHASGVEVLTRHQPDSPWQAEARTLGMLHQLRQTMQRGCREDTSTLNTS